MRERLVLAACIAAFALLAQACNRQSAELKPIQQQRAGDYLVSVLNETGVFKQRSNNLMLEIRNAASNELTNVNNVQIQASMRMPGMGPMFGNVSSTRQVGPGRYNFDADVAMAGQWSFVVTFEPGGRAQFNLNAQ